MANQSSVCPSHSAPFDMAVRPVSINTLFRPANPQARNISLVYLNLPQPTTHPRSQVPGRRNVVRVRVRAPSEAARAEAGAGRVVTFVYGMAWVWHAKGVIG
jgi:hypothetical protein